MKPYSFFRRWRGALMVLLFLPFIYTCDTFSDENICLYDNDESKIWTPDNNQLFYYGSPESNTSNITFVYNLSSDILDACYKITNICDRGPVIIKVKIFEKPGVDALSKPTFYKCVVVDNASSELFGTTTKIPVYRVSDTYLEGNLSYYVSFLTEKPQQVIMSVAAFLNWTWNEPGAEDKAKLWAKQVIDRIEINVHYTVYQ